MEYVHENKLSELVCKIDIPEEYRNELLKLARKADSNKQKISRSIGKLQESVDYLRLTAKYLRFDLEATRRENAAMKKMLEDSAS